MILFTKSFMVKGFSQAVLLVICGFFLCGCYSIPTAPKQEYELLSQCCEWNHYQCLILDDAIKQGQPKEHLSALSGPLLVGSDACLNWVGPPEEPFRGDINKLNKKMNASQGEYERDLREWKDEVGGLSGERLFTGSSLLTWLGFIGGVMGIIIFISVIRFR